MIEHLSHQTRHATFTHRIYYDLKFDESLNLQQTCGRKIYRTNSASTHPRKVFRKCNWNAAPIQCKSSCWRKRNSPAWCTREAVSTSRRRLALWRAEEQKHLQWSSLLANARHFKTVTCSQTWLLFSTTQNWWRQATLPSKSNATLECREV